MTSSSSPAVLADQLKAIRDKFLIPTPDKDHTDYAVMTRCIEALGSSPKTSILAPADGQVASQREAVAWRIRAGLNHPLVEGRPFDWRLSETRPSLGEGAKDEWFDVEPLYTSPTDQSSDVSGLVEALEKIAAGREKRSECGTFTYTVDLDDAAEIAAEALAQAKRDGGNG